MSDTTTEKNQMPNRLDKEAIQLGTSLDCKNLPSGGSGTNSFSNSAGSFRRVTPDSTPKQWGTEEAKDLKAALVS